jgi:hypothetical protein
MKGRLAGKRRDGDRLGLVAKEGEEREQSGLRREQREKEGREEACPC